MKPISINLLESIIREERDIILSEQETQPETLKNSGHPPYEIVLGTVKVNADRQFVSVAENKAYVRYIKAVKELNELFYSIGSPRNMHVKIPTEVLPGRRLSKTDDQTDQWKAATKYVNKMIKTTKSDIRAARPYYNFAKKHLGAEYGVTIFEIIEKVDGLYAMRAAHKKYTATLGQNSWFTSQSPFRDYYDRFGKWVDPGVNKLTDEEVEQLKKSWAAMLAFADAIKGNPFKALWILVEQGLAGGLQAMENIMPGIADAWSSWDGFINHEEYGLRTMMYTPAGIAGSIFANLFPTTAAAVRVAYALLVIDDVIKISQGGGWENWLFLIIDATGVLAGTSVGSKIAKDLFKPIGNAFGKLFTAIVSGNVKKSMITNLHKLFLKLPMDVRIMINEVAQKFVKLIEAVGNATSSVVQRFRQLADDYPLIRDVANWIAETIEREFLYYKEILYQIRDMFKIIAAIFRYISDAPGIALLVWLEQRGFQIIGTQRGNIIRKGSAVFVSTSLLFDFTEYVADSWLTIGEEEVVQECNALLTDLQKETYGDQDVYTGYVNEKLKEKYGIDLMSILSDPNRKIYMVSETADSVFIVPGSSWSGQGVPIVNVAERSQAYNTGDYDVLKQLQDHYFELVRVDSIPGQTVGVSYRLQLLPELVKNLSPESKRLYQENHFVGKKRNFQKVRWNKDLIKTENKTTMNLKTIIREEYSKILEAEGSNTTRKKLKEAEAQLAELQKQYNAANEQLKKEKEKVGPDGHPVNPETIDELKSKITNLEEQINTKQEEINQLKNQLENELTSEQPLPPDLYYKKATENNKKNGIENKLDLTTVKTPQTTNTIKLSKKAAASFERMYADMPENIQNTIYITDGFRTYETQYDIVDWNHWKSTGEYRKKTDSGETPDVVVSEPGTSNHGFGNAIDIGPYKGKDNPADWIKENGVAYGWLWCTKDGGEGEKSNEPWHFIYNETKDTKKGGGGEEDNGGGINPEKCPEGQVYSVEEGKCIPADAWWEKYLWIGGGFLVAAFLYSMFKNQTLLRTLGIDLQGGAGAILKRRIGLIRTGVWGIDKQRVLEMKDKPNQLRALIASVTTNKTAEWILKEISASGQVRIMLDDLYESGLLNRKGYEAGLQWMEKNAASLNRAMAKRTMKTALDAYRLGQLTLDELKLYLPANMAKSETMLRILNTVKGDSPFVELYFKQVMTPDELRYFKEVAENGWTPEGEIVDFYLQDEARITRLVQQKLYPVPVHGLTDAELNVYLSKVKNVKPPKDVGKWTLNSKGNISRDPEFDLNNSIINYQTSNKSLPEKWKKDFPSSLQQWKKEWKEMYGSLPSDIGLNDSFQYTLDYWTSQRFQL